MNIIHVISTNFFVCLIFIATSSFSCKGEKIITEKTVENKNNMYTQLSVDLIEAVKSNQAVNELRKELSELNQDSLAAHLISDNQKKAFWINVYNAHIQILLQENPSLYKDRGAFFSKPRITIAGKDLSFDDIEHGIIRSSKFKLALGLIRNPFANSFEKKFRTKKTDYRIHFALNCGAKSCPLVATYQASNFDEKIDRVAKNFLQKVSTYNESKNTVYTTSLFSWFRGDFDGKKGILKALENYNVIPKKKGINIEYNDYDWTLSLGNYYESK